MQALALAGDACAGVGVIDDLAHIGMTDLHPAGCAGTPRRTLHKKERPTEDKAYNTAFAKHRITVEHSIGQIRRYQALRQTDRHHRRKPRDRTEAVAGFANRHIRSRLHRAA